jgi:hypothetical protein
MARRLLLGRAERSSREAQRGAPLSRLASLTAKARAKQAALHAKNGTMRLAGSGNPSAVCDRRGLRGGCGTTQENS